MGTTDARPSSLLAVLLLVGVPLGCGVCPPVDDPPPGPLLLDANASARFRNVPAPERGGPAEPERILALLEAPVIDVHAHAFNARYLPLRNILLGKRDATPWATFLYDRAAKRIAGAVVAAASLTEIPGAAADGAGSDAAFEDVFLRSYGEDREAARRERDDPCVKALRGVCGLDEVAPHAAGDDSLAARDARLDQLGLAIDQRFHADVLKDLERALEKLAPFVSLNGVTEFLQSLVARDGDLERRYHRAFGGQIDLMVHHTMDLAPVYAQEEDGVVLLPYASEQLRRSQHFQSREDARQLYFVAYNPFRDNRGHPGRALEIVREAIETQGAYGIKVYPSSGYRPARNVVPYEPFALFTDEPGRQWRARYDDADAPLLDARLDALFAYCVEKDVPVFTHCLDEEFEARKGYSACFADPRWWRPVLAAYPSLRLCFGHAGSEEFWFGGDAKHESWGRLVYELCVTYPNVYAEFGVHAAPLDPVRREHFIALVDSLITNPQGDFPIQDKLLFGSDWYMPSGNGSPEDFLEAYRAAFTDRRLVDHYVGFFAGNALAYLGAEARLTTSYGNLPENVKAQLAALLERTAAAAAL